jgi:hypothetical protein
MIRKEQVILNQLNQDKYKLRFDHDYPIGTHRYIGVGFVIYKGKQNFLSTIRFAQSVFSIRRDKDLLIVTQAVVDFYSLCKEDLLKKLCLAISRLGIEKNLNLEIFSSNKIVLYNYNKYQEIKKNAQVNIFKFDVEREQELLEGDVSLDMQRIFCYLHREVSGWRIEILADHTEKVFEDFITCLEYLINEDQFE